MRIPERREFEFPVIATLRIRHFFDALFRRVGRSRFRGSINGRTPARQGFCRKYARTTDEEDFLQNSIAVRPCWAVKNPGISLPQKR